MRDKKVVKKSFFIKMRQKLGVNHIKSIIKWKITSSEAISFKHFAITVNLFRCWASGLSIQQSLCHKFVLRSEGRGIMQI